MVDRTSGDESPVAPVRQVVGEVLGPAQAGVSNVLGPIVAIPDNLRTNDALRGDLANAERRINDLENDLRDGPYDANRLRGLDDLCAMFTDLAYFTVPARVIGYGSAQTFSSTVTIDAGSDSGVRPDLTVLNADGLVGRVIEVTSHTATVLLIVDSSSTVGGRVGDNLENGFVEGQGGLAGGEPLNLDLIDRTVVPEKGQTVVTWGSEGGGPYVAGVPIGEVSKVYEDLRAGTYRAVLEPYVDFTSLDDVGVVVPSGDDTRVIEPGACS